MSKGRRFLYAATKVVLLGYWVALLLVALLIGGCMILPHRPESKRVTEMFDSRTGILTNRVTMSDNEGGGGAALGMSPSIHAIGFSHTNAALGSGTSFNAQGIVIVVATNDADILKALGEAVGSGAGAFTGTAARKMVGLP